MTFELITHIENTIYKVSLNTISTLKYIGKIILKKHQLNSEKVPIFEAILLNRDNIVLNAKLSIFYARKI